MDTYVITDFPKVGRSYGNYNGKTALDAAKKAFIILGKTYNVNNSNITPLLVFSLKNKRNNKIHKFMGTRIELYNPNNTVKKYKNIVTDYIAELDEHYTKP